MTTTYMVELPDQPFNDLGGAESPADLANLVAHALADLEKAGSTLVEVKLLAYDDGAARPASDDERAEFQKALAVAVADLRESARVAQRRLQTGGDA